MRKFTLLAAMLLSCSISFAQSVEFIRNDEVVPDGTTITVTELDGSIMDPAVHIRNSSAETVNMVLKVSTVSSTEYGNCSYCGLDGSCVTVPVGASLAKGMALGAGRVENPLIDWMFGYKDEKKANATIKYELKVGATFKYNEDRIIGIEDEGTLVSTITVNFKYDATSINSVNANSNLTLIGNELSYRFDNVANRQLNIYNVTGSKVKSEMLETEGTVVIDKLNKGIYIYEVVENGKRIAAHKCIIK